MRLRGRKTGRIIDAQPLGAEPEQGEPVAEWRQYRDATGAVIALWNSNDGWIPGAGYKELAEAFGVGAEADAIEQLHASVHEAVVVERVIELWNNMSPGGGWIPGAAYEELAAALGVSTDRLVHYANGKRHYPEGTEHMRPEEWLR